MTLATARNPVRGTLVLLVAASVGTALLAYTYEWTREKIVAAEDREKLVLVDEILPPASYDNRILQDRIKLVPNPLLGTTETTDAYRARMKGKPVAVVFEAVAADGYGGKIRLLVSVSAAGEVNGVRVIAHNETPGWGDYIEIAKSPWIRGFEHASLTRYTEAEWQVRKDGGRFDYVARATVSPRAVVGAVRRALRYFSAHADTLFDPKAHLVTP